MQERFKQLLEEKNLTATKFAALIKVNASAMSHILNGRSKPGFDVLDKIGQAFPDVNLNWLISGKGHMYLSSPATEHAEKKQPQQKRLFEEEIKAETTLPDPKHSVATPLLPANNITGNDPRKKIKRIILFFEDGSFEDYEK